MTKKEMILAMIGEPLLPESSKRAFWNRALKKDKEWLEKLYRHHLENTKNTPKETRAFCFALLNR